MPKLNFARRHSLSIAEAKQQVDALVEDFKTQYSKYLDDVVWSPDGLSAKATGRGFSAQFAVTTTRVDVAVDLSFLATPIKGKIEQRVNERLD